MDENTVQIPYDPQILVSFINTQLRDNYSSLDDLCKGLNLNYKQLVKKLGDIEYVYNKETNRFV